MALMPFVSSEASESRRLGLLEAGALAIQLKSRQVPSSTVPDHKPSVLLVDLPRLG